ncbi:MAG: hypothetical protein GF401_17420 [Chitinivibrionales bacterium]|nr:hypothetical protein [Chitinivibrionales bacterium]
MIKKTILTFLCLILISGSTGNASPIANPTVAIPDARASVGISYHLGGYSITADTVPCMLNRVDARLSYSPVSMINFGIDLGAVQMSVAGDTGVTDTVGVFDGNFGFSGGGHLKVSSPFFFNERLAVVGIAKATYFTSENDQGAFYGGTDGAGVLGVQFHIPGFGYITAGPMLYVIMGENRSYNDISGEYSNVNNLRGWLSIDFFPRMKIASNNLPYISFEISLSPEADFNNRAPIEEFSFSISVGTVTKRLYGEMTDIEWQP